MQKPEAPAMPRPRGPRPGHGPGPGPLIGEKPKDFRKSIMHLLAFCKPYARSLIVVAVLAVLSTAFSVVGPLVMGNATTELVLGIEAKAAGTGGIDISQVRFLLLLTLGIYLVSALCSFLQSFIMAGVTQKITFSLREALNTKLNRLPFGYFEKNPIGDTLSRITNDVDTLSQNISSSITQIITSAVTLIGVVAMMLVISPLITLLIVLVAPLGFFFASLVVKKSQKFFVAQQNQLGVINTLAEETISGHDIVKAFTREARLAETFRAENAVLYEASRKSQFISSFIKPLMDIVGNAGYVVVAIVGGWCAACGFITVGNIQSLIQYQKSFMQPINSLAQIANILQLMAAAAERVFEVLDAPEDTPDVMPAPVPAAAAARRGEIEFRHVRFGYDSNNPVIKDFSATIHPGDTVALVGETGAGKTTIVKLLMRFYEVQAGEIVLDGVDIRTLPRETLRSNFSMVLQDTWLFSGSIADNIAYGCPNAKPEDIAAAAEAAHVTHFIDNLPGRYDYIINEEGDNISLGQRQLITIARALLADRPFLILDEATSSVDSKTEEEIRQAMARLTSQRTSLVIAHRLSTIRNADLVLVMRDGDIVEQGTHDSLIAQGGFYASLYNAQFEHRD